MATKLRAPGGATAGETPALPAVVYVVAGLKNPRTLLKTCRKNLITRGSTKAETTNPAATTKNNITGRNTASNIETTASRSSDKLTTILENGSGLVLTIALVAALVP